LRLSPRPTTPTAGSDHPVYPSTRGASATSCFRPTTRSVNAIALLEKLQPGNALPPRKNVGGRGRQHAPNSAATNFSYQSHFVSIADAVNNSNDSSRCHTPRCIPIGNLVVPLNNSTLRARSAGQRPATGDPNTMSPAAALRRGVRSVTPKGRRNSSGIFDAMRLPSPTLTLNTVNNMATSNDNTLRSPTLVQGSAARHESKPVHQPHRTYNNKESRADAVSPVCTRAQVTSPHAFRLRSSNQVGETLSWM
jgi:hypothetical protein